MLLNLLVKYISNIETDRQNFNLKLQFDIEKTDKFSKQKWDSIESHHYVYFKVFKRSFTASNKSHRSV